MNTIFVRLAALLDALRWAIAVALHGRPEPVRVRSDAQNRPNQARGKRK